MGETETGVDSVVQTVAGQDYACSGEDDVADDDDHGEQENHRPVLGDHRRRDHHSDRDKEYGSEKVLDWLNNVVNMLAFRCFGQNRSHNEGSEGRRETDRCGQRDHPEAESDADNQQNLVVEIFLGLFQQGRDDVDAHKEP